METRFVPDAPGAWLVYDLGTLVLALPPEFRAAADAVAALPGAGVDGVLAALRASGIADAAPFATVDAEGDGVRVALRGPATVSAGSETLTGLGAEPWLDRVVRGARVIRLTVPGGEWTLDLATPRALAASPASAPTPVAGLPETSVPSTSIPSTSVPSTSIPGSSGPKPSIPVPPGAGAFPAPPPGPAHPPVPAPPAPAPAAATPAPPPPLLEPQDELTEIPEHSAPPGLAASAEDPGIGEHDGHTVLASDLPSAPAEDKTVVVDEIARLRAKRSAGLAAPVVAPAEPPAPVLSLELPDGTREPLDAVLVLGRAPAAPEGARVVRLGDGDISRTHARVAVEGGTVVVTDLGSRNGTVVRMPGRPPQKLREHEPTPVLPGTVIDFGGGVELRVREG